MILPSLKGLAPEPTGKQVAVLMGGISSEREVSLSTGEQFARAAESGGYAVSRVDAQAGVAAELMRMSPDAVLNGLHGPFGEDGRIQGILDWLGLPYTHSGVLASALAMDKVRAKRVLAAAGLDTAADLRASRSEIAARHLLPPPYVVKPVAEGSSFGILMVREGDPPPAEVAEAGWQYGDDLMVEAFIPGRELTVGVLGGEALGVTEITTLRRYYDFEAKYAPGRARHEVPADISDAVAMQAMDAALTAHRALGCRGVTRSDFRYDEEKGRLVILELNTQPGMTPTSLVPEQAAWRGLTFEGLVGWMIEDASCPR